MTVGESLQVLRGLTGAEQPQVVLKDCFVDVVETRSSGMLATVMCPGRRVAEEIDSSTPLRGYLLSEMYQNEYRVLDEHFPYQQLTLERVGIPDRDILQVHTGKEDMFVVCNG